MSVLMSLVIFPTDKGSSVSKYVSRVVEIIRDTGYDYRLTPMATIIETPSLNHCTEIIEKAYSAIGADSERVYITATFDIRTNGTEQRLNSKIASVESKIGDVKK
ncbi:MAG: MTH1187 family thiamine-binding protein [Bacteroidales bacterium]|nr:MTH1187 family thiamine-binding protein [Bacteroidales bacterium]HOY38209.1 MTH1187 family thiamine-binding protein [Bacteroidales bacterium]HQP03012.1 MTH1187 family thiamine-binding protein [Bacteroidales bacterium]